MEIYLAKTLKNMKKFGPVYDLSMEPEERVESYKFGFDENQWLLEHLIDGINAERDTLLDDGDYDYFGMEQCKKLLIFLSGVDEDNTSANCRIVIEKLREYAERAIRYETGMAIDL